MKETAKRFTVLLGMLALMLGTLALPALAESEPRLTGVIEKPEVTTYMYGTHAITDGAVGEPYALQSDVVDLDAYVGQRVTVFGSSVPGYEDGQVEGGPPLFDVTRVEPTGGGTGGGTTTTGGTVVSGGAVNGGTNPAEKSVEPSAKSESIVSSATKMLPATGGVLPIAGVAGLVIVIGGLVVRRIAR